MNNLEKYIKLRDEFSSKLEAQSYESELAAWNFYSHIGFFNSKLV